MKLKKQITKWYITGHFSFLGNGWIFSLLTSVEEQLCLLISQTLQKHTIYIWLGRWNFSLPIVTPLHLKALNIAHSVPNHSQSLWLCVNHIRSQTIHIYSWCVADLRYTLSKVKVTRDLEVLLIPECKLSKTGFPPLRGILSCHMLLRCVSMRILKCSFVSSLTL